MTILIILFVVAPIVAVALLVIGILSLKQDKQPREMGFAIDPKILRSGRHLPVSRGGEGEFISRH